MSSLKRVASGNLTDSHGVSTAKKSKLDSLVSKITPGVSNFENLTLSTPISVTDRKYVFLSFLQ